MIAGASISTIATVASVAAGALQIGATLTAKKPTTMVTGSQTSFSANPDDGLPLMLGRTGTAGKIVYRTGFDTRDAGDNDRQVFVSMLSVGPIAVIEGQTVDQVPVSYTATGAAIGTYSGWMWSQTQLGALPEGSPLGFGVGAGTPPGWGSTHKLSGKAAASWTLRFDTKGKMFQAGVPAPMWVGRGVRCYDPTKDSTYPGGSGPQRMADPSDTAAYDAAMATWEWTENPYLLAMRWAHGVWQRDPGVAGSTYQRVMGIGAPWALIDVAAFVEGRNIAVANGWKAGGIVYSTDGKWDTMKRILQAGMGEPMALGARISCFVNAPKVSLATITADDVVGAASVTATQSRRDRVNTITPRYRLEANNWQYLPGAPISVPEHVAFDGGKRSKLYDYPLIQDTKQVATAVRYDIENAREFGPIVLPLKLVWMGYKPGDCVTATLPELGLNAQPILLLNRQLAPASGVVTMTARSETAAKHPFALGQTTTPPPTPGVTAQPIVPMPRDGDWTLAALPAGGQLVTPTLAISGACGANVDGVVFEYRVFDSGAAWTAAGSDAPTATYREITGLRAGTAYEVAVSYTKAGVSGDRRVIGPVTTAVVSVKGDPGAGAVTLVAGSATTIVEGNSVSAYEVNNNRNWGTDAAYSREAYTGGAVATFTIPAATEYVMAGLTQGDPGSNPGNSFDSITFALYRDQLGQFYAYVNGGQQNGTTAYTNTGEVKCRVQFDGRYVRWYAASTLIYVFDWMGTTGDPNAAANALRFRTALAANAQLRDITLSAAGAAGKNGQSALVGYLTNEAHNVAADAAGNPVTYAGASGQFRVLLGGTDVTSACTFALVSDSIITAAINSSGAYGLTGFPTGSSSGYAVFRATYPGYPPIDATFSVTKTNAGANGAPAVDIQLSASADVVKYTGANVIASGPITFTTTRKNTTDAPVFRLEGLSGNSYAEDTAAALAAAYSSSLSSTGPDNLTITEAWIDGRVGDSGDGGGGLRVRVTVPGASDRKTLLKVRDGASGQDGVPGYNNAAVAIYQRAASAPPLPTTTGTYTFATASLTGINNGWWTNGIPDGTDPVWASSATASSRDATDTIAPGEWAAPVQAFANGAAGGSGLNNKSVFAYQRATSAPSAPSVNATYTFSTATLSGLNNGWSAAIPDGTGILWVTTASALSTSDTDTIAPGEWATVEKLAQDGAPGISPLLVTAQPAALQLQGDAAGAAVPGALPAYIENGAARAGVPATITDVTIDAASGCTASVADDGTTIAITAISKATASVSYTVSAAGLSQQVKVGITVLRAPTSLEERGLNIGSGGTSTSYDVFGGTISIQAGSSGKVDTQLTGTYYSGGSGAIGTTRLVTKHQYRLPGGSWVDVSGTEGAGSDATRANGGPGEPPENSPGSPYGAIGHITGLTAGTYYEVRALAYYDAGVASAKPATGVGCVLIAKQVA